MRRYELTEFEWRTIAPLLPNKPCGVPRVDDRRVLNGIFWVLRSGSPWRDLPERYVRRQQLGNVGFRDVGGSRQVPLLEHHLFQPRFDHQGNVHTPPLLN